MLERAGSMDELEEVRITGPVGSVDGYHVTRLFNEQTEGTLTRTLKDRDGSQRQT